MINQINYNQNKAICIDFITFFCKNDILEHVMPDTILIFRHAQNGTG